MINMNKISMILILALTLVSCHSEVSLYGKYIKITSPQKMYLDFDPETPWIINLYYNSNHFSIHDFVGGNELPYQSEFKIKKNEAGFYAENDRLTIRCDSNHDNEELLREFIKNIGIYGRYEECTIHLTCHDFIIINNRTICMDSEEVDNFLEENYIRKLKIILGDDLIICNKINNHFIERDLNLILKKISNKGIVYSIEDRRVIPSTTGNYP